MSSISFAVTLTEPMVMSMYLFSIIFVCWTMVRCTDYKSRTREAVLVIHGEGSENDSDDDGEEEEEEEGEAMEAEEQHANESETVPGVAA